MHLILERFAYTSNGTFGVLVIDDKPICYIIERPWRYNEKNVSCIPEGIYPLKKRQSGVVSRSTRGKYSEGWEVCNVPDRTYIMVHPANVIGELEGCLAPGEQLSVVYNK